METTSSKTWLWIILAAVAVVAAGWLWQGSRQAVAPAVPEVSGPALSESDTTSAIEQELNATDFGNLEADLQSTEADLQSL